MALRPRPSELQPSSEGTGFLTGALGQSNSPSPISEDWVNNVRLGGDAHFLRFACGILGGGGYGRGTETQQFQYYVPKAVNQMPVDERVLL